jgi:hypothetical protein
LPIPDFQLDCQTWNIAQEIAKFVEMKKQCSFKKCHGIDLSIERLVVKLYRLTSKECKWVVDTLKNAQQLEIIKKLVINDYQEIVAE